MSVSGPHIQAAGYSRGRSKAVRTIVLHSAEGATDEVGLGQFFARTRSGSSNAGIGQDGGYASYVNYSDTPWTNPPTNSSSDTVELCGFAAWSRAQWLAKPKMLETAAAWIAWRCAVRRVPIVLLEPKDLLAGKAGVTDHRRINGAFHKSDHWDVGYNFPWDVVITRARQIAGVGGPAPSTTTFYVVKKGDTLDKIAKVYKVTAAAIAAANGIRNANLIQVGQKLKIPKGASPVPTPGMGRFPLPAGHYFSTRAANARNHSGYYAADQGYIKVIQSKIGAGQDGIYGTATASLVGAWQSRHGLRADRVVGSITWARMAAS